MRIIPNIKCSGMVIMGCMLLGTLWWFSWTPTRTEKPPRRARNPSKKRGGQRKSRGARRLAQMRAQLPGGTVRDPQINSKRRRRTIQNDATADRTELCIFQKRKVPSWWKQFKYAAAFLSDNLVREGVMPGKFDADVVLPYLRLIHRSPQRESFYSGLRDHMERSRQMERDINRERETNRLRDEINHHITWKFIIHHRPDICRNMVLAHNYGQLYLNTLFIIPDEFQLEREMNCWSMGNCARCGNSAPVFRDCLICFDRAPKRDPKEAYWRALECFVEEYHTDSVYRSKHDKDLHEPWICRPCRGEPPLGTRYPSMNRWAW
ncbi:hypothetical protein QAD02_013741 [Eretmocerus hayati]|uniref:Uncharacterized protein n=1 Tax=Eretmocerus hayati TaxID=131215 RepID=A0ACC2P3Q8_9HYME|nr:hypothetical protein QAD02_013741 [Eretmocerus hayati]